MKFEIRRPKPKPEPKEVPIIDMEPGTTFVYAYNDTFVGARGVDGAVMLWGGCTQPMIYSNTELSRCKTLKGYPTDAKLIFDLTGVA